MTGQDGAPSIMNLEELLGFREITERISSFLHKRLKDHLATLSTLLAPGRVLGKHVGTRDSVPRAEDALAELTEKYKLARGGPFDLKEDLDGEALTAIGAGIQVYPYEYSHEAQGAKAAKKISMTSPIRWVVTYGADYSLSQFRNALLVPGERRSQAVRQFVVNALAFQVVLGRNPSVGQLLGDLRYESSVKPIPGIDKLPMTVLSIPLPSFRPADELLLTAIRISGVPAFIELIDINAVRSLEDPLRMRIEELAQESG